MSGDTNFDALYSRFERNIRHNNKGYLRDTLLREDIEEVILAGAAKPLAVIDGGCGLGQNAIWLAQKGHSVRAFDISAKMVAHTAAQAEALSLSSRLAVSQQSVQDVLDAAPPADLLCLHSVMEWLADPYALVPRVSRALPAGAYLSLSVYNLHRSVFNSLVNGDVQKILRGDFSGSRRSLTPPQPINPEQLLTELVSQGLEIKLYAGLRCFYDYFKGFDVTALSLEDLLRLERRYRKVSPYREFARYVHIIAQKLP